RLKKPLLIRYANTQNARSNKKKSDKNDLPIIDSAYDLKDDEAVETNIDNERSRKITEFFSQRSNSNSNNDKITDDTNNEIADDIQLDYESETEKQMLQETKKRIQHLIDTSGTSKTDKIKYISVIHYLKLLQGNTFKMEASSFLPSSQRGKHPSKSLINDEEDVIAYRREFLRQIAEYDRLMPKWNNINCKMYEEPNLFLPGEKRHILITHDECVFYAYDDTHEF
ncbi:24619_t:CDS:2, partial [Gigaspora margarita]